ncbi:MAG: class I SAM-dependent methyltransferase [Alphaproteobacteria bacterium]|nr:class I SAM-dependent methyltransferase [Alphaproteobacteria bacterium]
MTETSPSNTLDGYYQFERHEIFPLIEGETFTRALEIGCGAGDTLSALKRSGQVSWTGGVELATDAAALAEQRLDRVWTGNVENIALDIEPGTVDLLLCLDVLEHLVDPWRVLAELTALVRPGGTVVISLPNLRHYKVSLGLVFNGRFDYQPSGLMDRTHLRWFVKDTALELVRGAGLEVVRLERTGKMKPWRPKWLLNKLTFGALTELYAYQYLIKARKPL